MSLEPLAPPDEALRSLLESRPVIAVVGASSRSGRPSHRVVRRLIAEGYEVHPVNPYEREVHGRRAWPDLASVPDRVDLVDVFRRTEATPDVARAAVAIGARVLWLQVGIVNEEAAEVARAAGLVVVMDRCLAVEHDRLVGRRHPPGPRGVPR